HTLTQRFRRYSHNGTRRSFLSGRVRNSRGNPPISLTASSAGLALLVVYRGLIQRRDTPAFRAHRRPAKRRLVSTPPRLSSRKERPLLPWTSSNTASTGRSSALMLRLLS